VLEKGTTKNRPTHSTKHKELTFLNKVLQQNHKKMLLFSYKNTSAELLANSSRTRAHRILRAFGQLARLPQNCTCNRTTMFCDDFDQQKPKMFTPPTLANRENGRFLHVFYIHTCFTISFGAIFPRVLSSKIALNQNTRKSGRTPQKHHLRHVKKHSPPTWVKGLRGSGVRGSGVQGFRGSGV